MMKNFKIKTNHKGRGYKYNRVYVKKNNTNFIPFSKGSYISKWDDDYWHGNKKINNYIERFLLKNVGNNIDDVFFKFSKLDFRNQKEMYHKWQQYIKQEHTYSWDLFKWGKIYGFYVDKDNILCYNKWNKNEYKEFINVPIKQLEWNENRKIPNFGKVRETPLGNFIGSARSARYINDFYIIYKGEILLLPVYHIPCGEIHSLRSERVGTKEYKHNQKFNECFKHVCIHFKNGCGSFSNDWYDYYSGKEMVVDTDGTRSYVNKTIIGNLGYRKLNPHIIISQAEKEYEKVMFQKRISSE